MKKRVLTALAAGLCIAANTYWKNCVSKSKSSILQNLIIFTVIAFSMNAFTQTTVCFKIPDGVDNAWTGGWSYKEYIIPNSYKIDSVYGDFDRSNYPTASQDFIFHYCEGTTVYNKNTAKQPFDYTATNSSLYDQWIDLTNFNYSSVGVVRVFLPVNAGAKWNDLCFAISPRKGCNSNMSATITPQSNTTFCQGGSVTLQANTGNNYTYEWSNNGSKINGANQSAYTANASGNYTVKVIDGACNATSSAVVVTVNSNPSVSLASIGAFTNYSAAPVTLSGTPLGGTYSGPGVSGNTFNPKQAGLGTRKITYSYTNSNNCSGTAGTSTIVYDTLGTTCTNYTTVTDTLVIKAKLAGLNPPNNENTLKVFPNPASTHITIDNGDFAKMSGYSVKITNNAGQQVFQSVINQAKFYIDLSSWSGNGLYFVHLIDPQGNTVDIRKIVLQ